MSSCVIVRLFMCVVLAVMLMPAVVASQIILVEDFDSYTPGVEPPAPWWNMFSGVSGLVSTERYSSAPHSLRIESLPNWARWDCMTLTLPDRLMYSFEIYLTEEGRGASVGFGFVEPGTTNIGHIANALHFGNDGIVYFSTVTSGSTPVANWYPNQWVHAAVSIEWVDPWFGRPVASIWVNGSPTTEWLDADPQVLPAVYYGVEVPLNEFGVFGNNFAGAGTSVVYVDNILLEETEPLPVEHSTWGKVKSLFSE